MTRPLTALTFVLFMYVLLCCCISGADFPHKWRNVEGD